MWILVAIGLAAVALSSRPSAALSPVPAGLERHPVQAHLVADVTAVQPGAEFAAAVVLDMAPHWHTYWAFGGDAGLPTEVSWTLPAGFVAGPLQWPLPERYTEGGDLTVFGYADSVALLTSMRAPAQLDGDRVELTAQVTWLVCAAECIPGDTTLTLVLPVGASRPAHEDLFARTRRQVPRPLEAADAVVWTPAVRRGSGAGLEVSVRVEAREAAPGAEAPDFYPLDVGENAYIEAGGQTELGPGVARSDLDIVPYTGKPAPETLVGVLVFTDGDGARQGRQIRFPLTPTGGVLDLRGADFTRAADGTGLGLYLLMALLGGLILNLMPCVLPVISLKVMSLVAQAGEAPARIRQLGLAFTGGVLASFLGLAATVVVLKAGGEQIGWGFQFQAPGFVLFLTALVFVLALSLFGVVTLRLPGTSASLGGLADGEGRASSFFNGVLATILATPCTAPFLGAALGFAFSQPAPTVFAIFGATGLGMALPYLVLAWQPGWMRFLPRPGAWMERFKQGMGFLLMATVLWLLWVLGKQLGMEAVVWTCAFLLCLGLVAWLVGSWLDLRSSSRRRGVVWGASAVITIAAYLVFLHPLLTAPVPAAAGEVTGPWEPFSADIVEAHIAAGRIVFLDFTAEWCWTCKVNERTVLARDDVQAAFDEYDVALVKADWTRRDPEITRLLRAFGRSGVPLYVVFSPRNPQAPTVLPEVITPGLVIDAVRRAGGTTQD